MRGPAADPATRWRAVLDHVPAVHGPPREVSELSGGLTNINLKVRYDDRTVVVRVAQDGSDLLAIDREHEHRNSVAAAQAGVGAPVVDYLPDAGLLVVEYLEAETFTPEDLRDQANLVRVAEACRRLHGGPRFVNDFDMFSIQQGYLSVVQERGFRLPPRYLDFAPKAEQIRRALAVHPDVTVPCNNDLLAGNILDDGSRLWLIDYEYAGNNEPCFELGNIWSEATLEPELLDVLVSAYDGTVRRSRVARARLWGLMSKYGWMLWASIQSSVSQVDFDFWSWGLEKYDRAVAEFEDPSFERLLAAVTEEDR